MKARKNKSFVAYLDWITSNWTLFQGGEAHFTPPMHPGKILEENYLKKRKLSQTALAKKIGCTHAKVNEIVNGKRNISPEFALDLEKALGVSADFWLSLQTNYDLWKVRSGRR